MLLIMVVGLGALQPLLDLLGTSNMIGSSWYSSTTIGLISDMFIKEESTIQLIFIAGQKKMNSCCPSTPLSTIIKIAFSITLGAY